MSAASTQRVLSRAFDLLDRATTEDGCRAALAEVLAELDPKSSAARFLAHRSHLIIRGGERTLVREALAARDPDIRAFGEERGDSFDPPLRLYRCATTRPDDDGRLRTIETGGRTALGVQLSADGEQIYALVAGRQWVLELREDAEDGDGDEDGYSAEDDAALAAVPLPQFGPYDGEVEDVEVQRARRWASAVRLQVWRTSTGERVAEVRLGAQLDDDCCFAISPDERTLAVQRRTDFEIYALPERDGWARGERPRHRYRIACGPGPDRFTFLGDRRLLVNDTVGELSLWDIHTGERLGAVPSTGSIALLDGGAQLLMGGYPPKSGASLNLYALPALEPRGACSTSEGGGCSELALSPGQRWLATERARYERGADGRFDWDKSRYTIQLWPVAELRQALAGSSVASPAVLEPRDVATSRTAVSCLRFASESRLLSGHNDGSVVDWRIGADGGISSRTVVCHDIIVSGIAVHPRGHLAVSAGCDGRLVLLDLESRSSTPSLELPYARRSSAIRRHPLGIEVVIDDEVRAVVPLPEDLELEAPLSAEVRPRLAMAEREELGHGQLDDPPRLEVWGGYPPRCTDLVELDEKHGNLLTLDSRTFAVRLDDHIEFYRLR